MTKKQDEKQVNVKDLKPTRKFSDEEQVAAQRAYSEFEALTLGKKEMTMKELYDLKLYAKKRTDIEKDDSELTADQVVWKALYNSVEQSMSENMDPDEKANLDKLQSNMDSLGELSDLINKIVPLGQEIETEFVMQHAALTVYFDKSPENKYKTIVDGVTTEIVDSKNNLSVAERIEKAETVLKVVEANREHLYQTQLVDRHETLRKKLQEFEKIYRAIEPIVSKDEELMADEGLKQLFETTKEWLRLTKDLYASRTGAISAVKNALEADEFLPKIVIKNKGDVSGNITETDDFFQMMASYATLINKADEDENKIGEKRNPLSESLLGKQDEYIKFSEEKTDEGQSQDNKTSGGGMGTKTKWFIVIALSIVALSWGIWTAIGVFILGVIIINVLSSK